VIFFYFLIHYKFISISFSGVDSISEKIKAHGGYRYGNLKNYLLK